MSVSSIIRDRMRRIKQTTPCVDCGEFGNIDFDHVRGVKVWQISHIYKFRTVAEWEAEVRKCDARCRACHLRVTDQRRRQHAERVASSVAESGSRECVNCHRVLNLNHFVSRVPPKQGGEPRPFTRQCDRCRDRFIRCRRSTTSKSGMARHMYRQWREMNRICAHCGKYYPAYGIEADHIDRRKKRQKLSSGKLASVSDYVYWAIEGIDALRSELDLCQPLCNQCHTNKTYRT